MVVKLAGELHPFLLGTPTTSVEANKQQPFSCAVATDLLKTHRSSFRRHLFLPSLPRTYHHKLRALYIITLLSYYIHVSCLVTFFYILFSCLKTKKIATKNIYSNTARLSYLVGNTGTDKSE